MTHQIYHVEGMDCADCALKIEKGLRQLDGIETIQLDFMTGLLQVDGSTDPIAIRQRVTTLGYRLSDQKPAVPSRKENALIGFWNFLLARNDTRLAIIGGGLMLISLLIMQFGLNITYAHVIQVIALLIAGYPIARSALVNLWINHDFSINLLMSLAAIGAVILGDTLEAATLIFLYAIAEALEGFTSDRARSVLSEITSLTPTHATRLSDSGEEVVEVNRLSPGDLLLIRPGEAIPIDGKLASGITSINQAAITGESMPVEKQPGDTVFAGTINGGGTIHVQVEKLASESTLQRVIRLIEQAQSLRAPTQRFIDRFAKIYTPIMVVLAILVAILPPLLFHQPFFDPAPGVNGWFYRALALLVIACPCALVISAPVTVVSAITAAAQRGVLFKGGVYLESLAAIKTFAFDKTGTLTRGKPVVTTYRSVDCAGETVCQPCDDVLALASALEKRSIHPLAQSVLQAAQEHGVMNVYAPADSVKVLPGGLQGRVNGKLATIGNHALFDREHPHQNELCAWVDQAEQQGQTTMLVCDGDRVRGFISVADEIRSESSHVIQQLRQMGKEAVILTGDNSSAAQAVGAQVGIHQVHSSLLPDQKLEAIQILARQAGPVAMVGDGINDAPALAAADLGIAIGGAGSDQAMETADIVLMGSDLRQLPFAVRLSVFARTLIRQNVGISLATKLIFILLTLFGYTTLWMAVAADTGVSLLVTLNGMRAAKYQ